MNDTMIRIESVTKQYRLGQIGGTTLREEIQRISASIRHKEDPTKKIGEKEVVRGEIFNALNNISFEVERGERVGIIGHNGAGKSTLLKLISRVTAPTEGFIGLNGRVTSMLEVGTGFHGELTGRENIYMNGAILGMTRKEIDSKIEEIIDFSECRKFIDTPVKRYSSGMYVKLAFSVAAHLDSEIMIMDEVLAVGDMAFHKKCIDKMNDVSRNKNRTILYVSHNMNTIRQLCNRVVVLSKGRVVFNGDVEEGIAIYMGAEQDKLISTILLKDIPRPSTFHGSLIHINDFTFLDKKVSIFKQNESMKFRISFDAKEGIPGLQLYFIFKSSDDQIIGMSQTACGFIDAVRGRSYSCDFEMPLAAFSPGVYHFAVDIFSCNNEGKHLSYDHPLRDIFFKVENDDSIPGRLLWNTNVFGFVKMNDIQQSGLCGEI